MRKFWIKNAKGEIFDMNREDAFFSNPRGLGFSRKASFSRIGYMWAAKEDYADQKKPYGDMVFDGYEQYEEFVKIARHTPLTLIYQPLEVNYYMDIESFSIEKGEISYKDTFLTCKVTFNGISPWYTDKIYKRSHESAGKIYPYQYSYTYADAMSGEVNIENESAMDAYTKIVIYGPVKNPTWKATQLDVTIVEGKVLAELGEESCLVIDSNPNHLQIAECDLSGRFIRDLYCQSDFSTGRFLYIPQGNTKFKVSHSGFSYLQFYVEVMEFAG